MAESLDKLLEAGSEKAILHLTRVKLKLTETRKHEHEVTGKSVAPLTVRDYMAMGEAALLKRLAEIREALGEE